MTKYFLILAILISFISSGFTKQKDKSILIYSVFGNTGKDTIKDDAIKSPQKEYFLKNGKSFTILQSYESDYLVNVRVVGKGFPGSSDTILFDEIELIDTVMIADINIDGFEELYIFTRGFSPGAYDHVFGVTSDEDKSYTEINFYSVKPSEVAEQGFLNGWQGQDVYALENNSIKRTFPIYNAGDFYNSPSRGYRTLYYTIEKTEAGYYFKLKD
jgi:hypothetical protein